MRPVRRRLRQIDRQPLPTEIVRQRGAIKHNVLKGKTASQIWFDSQHQLTERHAGLVGVLDRFVHSHLVCRNNRIARTTCIASVRRLEGMLARDKGSRSEFKRGKRCIGGRQRGKR